MNNIEQHGFKAQQKKCRILYNILWMLCCLCQLGHTQSCDRVFTSICMLSGVLICNTSFLLSHASFKNCYSLKKQYGRRKTARPPTITHGMTLAHMRQSSTAYFHHLQSAGALCHTETSPKKMLQMW